MINPNNWVPVSETVDKYCKYNLNKSECIKIQKIATILSFKFKWGLILGFWNWAFLMLIIFAANKSILNKIILHRLKCRI